MGFFSSSQYDLIPSRGSNERPLWRIRPLASNAAQETFVVVPLDGDFAWEVLNKWASSALR